MRGVPSAGTPLAQVGEQVAVLGRVGHGAQQDGRAEVDAVGTEHPRRRLDRQRPTRDGDAQFTSLVGARGVGGEVVLLGVHTAGA